MIDPGASPHPAEGASLTARATAELALGLAARHVSDFARTMVPTGPPRTAYHGALVTDVHQLARLAADLLTAAIVVERIDRTPWEDLAEILGSQVTEMRARWQPLVDSARVELADLAGSSAPYLRDLDAWAVRHREDADPVSGDHPVTDALVGVVPVEDRLSAEGRRSTGT